jgi:hypothetical protein
MEHVVLAYRAAQDQSKPKTKTKSKTKTKTSSKKKKTRTKTPVKNKSSKKSVTKKKKQRAKTPPSSRKQKQQTDDHDDLEDEENDDFDLVEEEEEDPVVAYAKSGVTVPSNDEDSEIFGTSYFYWWIPLLFFSALVLYTMLVLQPEYVPPCTPDDVDRSNDCAAQAASFKYWMRLVHDGSRVFAPLMAFGGIASHPHRQQDFAAWMNAGILWYICSLVLPMCTVEDKHQRLLQWSVMGTLCVAHVFMARSFMSVQQSEKTAASAPKLLFSRALPFAIIGYYLVSELLISENGVLFAAHANMENDTVTFVLLLLKVVLPLIVGWTAACRVGYGEIGWRSLRATKQTLGVIACLLFLFSMMLEFEGQVILPLSDMISTGTSLFRQRIVFVCETLAIGLLATSTLLHLEDA